VWLPTGLLISSLMSNNYQSNFPLNYFPIYTLTNDTKISAMVTVELSQVAFSHIGFSSCTVDATDN